MKPKTNAAKFGLVPAPHPTLFESARATSKEELEKRNKHLAKDKRFDAVIGVVIIVNAVMIGVEVDHGRGEEIMDRLPYFFAELIFAIIFTAEMLVRQSLDHWDYFLDPWNVMDFHLVVLGCVDVIVSVILQAKADMKVLTAFRIIRMLRLVRNIRLLRMFRELWMIVKGFFDSLLTLFWVTLLLTIVTYTVAIFIVITVSKEPNCHRDWFQCEQYIGTVPKTMFTTWQVITLQSWATNIVRPIAEVSGMAPWLFTLVIVICTFGIMNVIVGVIVERTMEVAKENEDRVQSVIQKCEKQVIESMGVDFKNYDESGDGELNYEEFCEAIRQKKFAQKLRLIDVPLEEVEELFFLMDVDKSGTIDAEEFVSGVQRLKGTAKGKDMIQLIAFVRGSVFRAQKLHDRLEKLGDRADLILERLDEMWGMTEQELHEREWAVSRQKDLKKRIAEKQKILDRLDLLQSKKVPELKTKDQEEQRRAQQERDRLKEDYDQKRTPMSPHRPPSAGGGNRGGMG